MNSALPNIEKFDSHKLEFFKTHIFTKQNSTANIDLDKFHENLLKAKHEQQNLAMHSDDVLNPTHLLYELFSMDFLFSFQYLIHPLFKDFVGYSKKHQSLTISLIDEAGNVRAIAIRKSKDKDGNTIKWKTYGSKTYCPYKIEDDVIFLAVGMAEYLLFKMMNVSYILLQSDSMSRHISEEIISKAIGKHIVVFKENDESFSKLVVELQRIFIHSNIMMIDFEKLLNKPLTNSYDYRDYINEIGNIGIVEQQLEQEIIKQIKAKK